MVFLFVLALSSLTVYGLIIAGWASNSKFAFLGALRSAAQMISYEIAIALLLLTVVIYSEILNISEIVLSQENGWFLIAIFPVSVMFFICSLAETSRPPFDLPEAEAELVSGYNIEYSSIGFAFFFIAEYANIIFMSAMCSLLFVGGWLSPVEGFVEIPPMLWFCIKILLFVCIFIWIRAAFPRFRFDQLMVLMWRAFLPITFLLLTGAVGLHLAFPEGLMMLFMTVKSTFIFYWFRYICFIVVLCILSNSFYVHFLIPRKYPYAKNPPWYIRGVKKNDIKRLRWFLYHQAFVWTVLSVLEILTYVDPLWQRHYIAPLYPFPW
jgi:hypothetical protein